MGRSCAWRAGKSGSVLEHGHSRSNDGKPTPTYRSWQCMMARCYQKGVNGYERYGGAGIAVCERWHVFANFLADMGERPSAKHTIERKDNKKGYEHDNCRWATKVEQQRHRDCNRYVEYNGETLCLTEWAERAGMTYATLKARLDLGWSFDKAVTTPLKRYRKHSATA